MIIELLVSLALSVVGVPLSVLPTTPLDLDGFGAAVGLAKSLNDNLPVSEGLQAAGAVLAVHAAVLLFGVIRTIWRFVPVLGS